MATDKTEIDAFTGTATTGHEWDGIRELNTPLRKPAAVRMPAIIAEIEKLDTPYAADVMKLDGVRPETITTYVHQG